MTSVAPASLDQAVERAASLLRGGRLVALTGAGISTDSGIPDYRGPGSPNRTPMTYQEFISGTGPQQRYWARAHVGWRHISVAKPNRGHDAVRDLERGGVLSALITQNVDGLHEASGHQRVIALHGRIAEVVCLRCGHLSDRAVLHERLERLNPGYGYGADSGDAPMAPDGDALLERTSDFRLAACSICSGPLKPDVVFFGESVAKPKVAECFDLVAQADAMLVAGSSLQVMSGLRFVRAAAKAGKPVVIVNRGTTRGDELAALKIDAGCAETLTALVAQLDCGSELAAG